MSEPIPFPDPKKPEGLTEAHKDMLQTMAPFLEASGISIPGITRFAPVVDIMRPNREIALEVGRLVAKEPIFLKGDILVTVDESTGKETFVTPVRFCSWVEEFCTFKARRNNGVEAVVAVPVEVASKVLAADVFRACLRKLTAVNLVRLPVMREGGRPELLPVGYDEASQVLTVETIVYPQDMTLDDARAFFVGKLLRYPWASAGEAMPEERTAEMIQANPSAAVQVAAILGVYCRAMFAPGTKRPMILYIGNQPGTGKSTMAEMALIPVYGEVYSTDKPNNQESFQKLLETEAQNFSPYVFFDDIGGGIFSTALNRFITSAGHSGRVLGGNQVKFKVPNVSQVFATGNELKLSPDLQRRSLVVDLFLPGDVRFRKFENVITSASLGTVETRRLFLAACWAAVREWRDNNGCVPHARPLETFEEWTAVVGALTLVCGFADPLVLPDLPSGGDERGAHLRLLLVELASEQEEGCDFTRVALIEKARSLGILEEYVGCEGDAPLKQAENQKFGSLLKLVRGREYHDNQGRKFRFSHRRTNQGKLYPLEFI